MISVVTWRWKPCAGYRTEFPVSTVNTLRKMVARHYPKSHRFLCVTDDPQGLDPEVEVIDLWGDYSDLPSPFGKRKPSCYRRLKAFHPDIGSLFGDRFVSIDLDVVITQDVRAIFDRNEPFVAYESSYLPNHYNGSMFLLTAGARPQVWTQFDPLISPQQTKTAGCFGSDQGWITYCLGPHEATWNRKDGVYSWRNHLLPTGTLPTEARLVTFHGSFKPWSVELQRRHPWIKEHYR